MGGLSDIAYSTEPARAAGMLGPRRHDREEHQHECRHGKHAERAEYHHAARDPQAKARRSRFGPLQATRLLPRAPHRYINRRSHNCAASDAERNGYAAIDSVIAAAAIAAKAAGIARGHEGPVAETT